MENNFRKTALIAIIVLAATAGVVLSAFMLSRFMLKIQHSTEKSIRVKGVAEKLVRSDLASFSCSVKVTDEEIAKGYEKLDGVKKILLAKLNKLGFTDDMIGGEDIDYEAQYKKYKNKDRNGKVTETEVFSHYLFTYSLRVRTSQADMVADNVLKLYELTRQQINITVTRPEYFISNPEQYKLELVDSASASATQRALTIADKCNSQLGNLLTARQGVIQITRPASNDTSDYGVYDTSSVEKVIRVVVTLDFELK